MPEEKQSVASFESGLDELETVVKQLEKGDLPLERSIELFEKGMALSERCRKQLGDAETKIELIVKRGNRTEPEPFEA